VLRSGISGSRMGAEESGAAKYGFMVSPARCCSTGSGRLGGAAAA
jgi:hypothetical protein